MARLGIDFGTTNTVVVCSDRGRYPIVPHAVETAIGRVVRDIFPSLLAYDHERDKLLYGPDAERCLTVPGAERRHSVMRSIKRLLRDYAGAGRIGCDVRPDGFDTMQVLTGFAVALCESVRRSGLFDAAEPAEAVITWPANANGAHTRADLQMHFTEAWRHVAERLGAHPAVVGFDALNEPSAAAIEFADRMVHGNRTAARRFAGTVAIFDFGGGTFDCSLVRIAGNQFTVIDTAGIEELGGDDLDRVLAQVFGKKLGLHVDELPRTPSGKIQKYVLRERARELRPHERIREAIS
jgi:molecular chaperone DnaK (HSP70)